MAADQLLSDDPQAGLPPPAKQAIPPSTGYWEDRGMAGKVWHPADRRNSSDVGRIDNNLLGVPPEMAAVGAAKIGQAVAAPAASASARVIAGVKAVASQAAPGLKYEVTKTGLESIGVPTPIAVAAAMAIAGYKKGKPAPATAESVMPEGVDRYAPNVSAGQPVNYAPSAADVHGVQIERYAPNVSGASAPPAPYETAIADSRRAVAAGYTGSSVDPAASLASRLGTPPDVDAVKALVSKGVPPSAAVKAIAGNNPTKFGSLMTLYLRSRQVK